MAVGAQNAANCRDQLVAAVADAGMAEMAEIGEILADLGIGEAEQRGRAGWELTVALPGANELLQLAQVEAQPADDRLGDVSGTGGTLIPFSGGHQIAPTRGGSGRADCRHMSL